MRCNVLISGGTGSGKTTLLNCLTGFIDDDERVITCEDAAELQLQQPHVVRLETRPPNLEGEGEITMRDLVKNCLRMRPERIIVGEVRGPEAFDLLQAMNTGHDGSMGTLHANSPREALSRLESMITMGGYALPVQDHPRDDRRLDRRHRPGRAPARRLAQHHPHHRGAGHGRRRRHAQDLFVYEITGEDANGSIIGRHRSTGIARPRFWERAEYYNEDGPARRGAGRRRSARRQRQSAGRRQCLTQCSACLLAAAVWRRSLSAALVLTRLRIPTSPASAQTDKRARGRDGDARPRASPQRAAGRRRSTRRKQVADTLKEHGGAPEGRARRSRCGCVCSTPASTSRRDVLARQRRLRRGLGVVVRCRCCPAPTRVDRAVAVGASSARSACRAGSSTC